MSANPSGDRVSAEFTRWIIAELEELQRLDRWRVFNRIGVLEDKGWGDSMRRKDVVPLKDGIYELRVVGRGPAYRVLFFVMPGNPGRLAVLTSCVRKASMSKDRVKAAEINRALARRDAWLSERGG